MGNKKRGLFTFTKRDWWLEELLLVHEWYRVAVRGDGVIGDGRKGGGERVVNRGRKILG